MKGKLVFAAGLAVLATVPASANKVETFATFEACMATGDRLDQWTHWAYTCQPTSDGKWALMWTNTNKKK